MYIYVFAILSIWFLSKIGLCAFFVGSGLQRVKFGLSTCDSRLVGTGTSDLTFHWMGELLYHFFLGSSMLDDSI